MTETLRGKIRREALEEAARVAEHFANDELTKEEWPKHGLCVREGRFDAGAIGIAGENIARAIRKLAE